MLEKGKASLEFSVIVSFCGKEKTTERRLAMGKSNKLDFMGQPIFVGLDVHKKSWSVSIYSAVCEHKTFSQPPEVDILVNYLRRNFPGASYRLVYEAGYSGFWVHDQLIEKGVACTVVNPADVPTKDKERRTKRDRIDCRKLARSLRAGEIEGIYVPCRPKLEDRSLLRTRQGMVRKQTRCKNQIKGILFFYGIPLPEDWAERHWSGPFVRWLENLPMERASGEVALRMHLDELKHLRQIIARLDREIRVLAQTGEYGVQVRLLRTIPGISTLTAMILLTELQEITRFHSLDELASYVGLIPDTRSSGETEHTGELTKRRHAQLRASLVEAAWTAVRKDPALLMAFQESCQRMRKTRAIVKIARKLLNRVRYVLKNQTPYRMGVVQ
jgi:transposase